MTTQETINKLTFIRNGYENLIENAPDEFRIVGKGVDCTATGKHTNPPYSDFVMALDIAISAIEKQIPKKPVIKIIEHFVQGYLIEDKYYICPCCKEVIGNVENVDGKHEPYIKKPKHCDPCGQALDWS